MSDGRGWGEPGADPRGGPAAGGPGWAGSPPGAGGAGWAAASVKPGVIPLRPLGVTEILDGAVTSVRRHPLSMIGLSALVVTFTQVLSAGVSYALLRDLGNSAFPSTGELSDLAPALTRVSGATLIPGLLAGLAQLVLTGVLTVVVSKAVLGQDVPIGEAWRQARPRLPALLAVSLLYGLIAALAFVVPLVPGLVVLALGSPLVGGLLLAVGGLLAVAALLFVVATYWLVGPATVLEKQSPLAALRRSRRLVAGAFWRVLGIWLLTQILVAIVLGLATVPFALAAGVLGGVGGNPFGALPLTLNAIGGILGGTIAYPFGAAITVLAYVDQRMRREGLDLALARAASGAGAAGGPAAPPTAP